MEPTPPPVSPQLFNFQTDRVANMSESEVEAELGNIYSGDPQHPYMNIRDGRHDAAVKYASALTERQIALRPVRDEAAELIAQRKAETRQKAEDLRNHLQSIGFEPFDLPDEVDDVHLRVMDRDILIQEGKLDQALFALRREIATLQIHNHPTVRRLTDMLDHAISDPGWDRDSITRKLATDAAFTLQQLVSKQAADRFKTAKAYADEAIQRDREGGR